MKNISYSVGKQPRRLSMHLNNQFPGVGAYNDTMQQRSRISRNKRGPMYSIGKSIRIKTEKNATAFDRVGPSSYNITKDQLLGIKDKGCTMGGRRNERINSQGPGPASYNTSPNNQKSSKKYSFGLKTQQVRDKTDRPGPGTYQIQRLKYSISVSFQNSKRPDVAKRYSQFPGPFNYDVKQFKQSKNKFAFPRRTKFFEDIKEELVRKVIPGPGNYNTENINFIKKKAITVKFNKKRRSYYENNDQPGPASYQMNNTSFKRQPVATIGKSPKQSPQKNISPGPGKYQNIDTSINNNRPATVVFPKASRQFKNKQLRPGPGAYDINISQGSGRCYSMSGKNSTEKLQKSPNPCSYQISYNPIYTRVEANTIGKQQRFKNYSPQNPGPGDYDNTLKSPSKTFNFAKEIKKQFKHLTPGPGAYNLQQTFNNGNISDNILLPNKIKKQSPKSSNKKSPKNN